MANKKMTVIKRYNYLGTELLGMEVTVIAEKIREGNLKYYKIRVVIRKGVVSDIWLLGRDYLLPSRDLTKVLYV